jgi:hypothetical protein
VTYCSDNVLVAIAEVLSAMHARVMHRLRERAPVNVIRATIREERSLVILPVRKIERLAYLESAALRKELGIFGGSLIVSAERRDDLDGILLRFLDPIQCRVLPSALFIG